MMSLSGAERAFFPRRHSMLTTISDGSRGQPFISTGLTATVLLLLHCDGRCVCGIGSLERENASAHPRDGGRRGGFCLIGGQYTAATTTISLSHAKYRIRRTSKAFLQNFVRPDFSFYKGRNVFKQLSQFHPHSTSLISPLLSWLCVYSTHIPPSPGL